MVQFHEPDAFVIFKRFRLHLLYTLRPLQSLEETYFQKKIREVETRMKLKLLFKK